MLSKRLHLLFWCVAVGLLSYIVLDLWSSRNAPLFRRLETQWADDVRLLETSKNLPPGWFDVKEVEIFGGTPETKAILRKIKVPVGIKKHDGEHKLEVLVVVWEEEGKRGALIQYNLVNLKSGNMIKEIGRTLILSRPRDPNPFNALLEDLQLRKSESASEPQAAQVSDPQASPQSEGSQSAPQAQPPATPNKSPTEGPRQ